MIKTYKVEDYSNYDLPNNLKDDIKIVIDVFSKLDTCEKECFFVKLIKEENENFREKLEKHNLNCDHEKDRCIIDGKYHVQLYIDHVNIVYDIGADCVDGKISVYKDRIESYLEGKNFFDASDFYHATLTIKDDKLYCKIVDDERDKKEQHTYIFK